jgi:hypothetical protein
VIIILAAHLSWSVHHMDAKSAFLNDDLGDEVYVSQPLGFIIKGQEQKVYKLHKVLYGLRQAPRTWNSKLDTGLHELGFSKCKTEYGLSSVTHHGALARMARIQGVANYSARFFIIASDTRVVWPGMTSCAKLLEAGRDGR